MRCHRPYATVALVLVMSACGLTSHQDKAVSDFGKAAGKYGDIASDAFPAMREAIRELAAAELALRPQLTPAQRTCSEPPLMCWQRLAAGVSPDDVAARSKVAGALRDYAAGLKELVDATAAADASKSIASIAESFAGVPSLKDDAESIKAVGSSLGPLTGLILAEYQARLVREVVVAADPAVQRAAEMLAEDFSNGESAILGAYSDAARRLARALDEARPAAMSAPAGSALRQSFLSAAALLQRHQDRIEVLRKHGAEAARSVGKGHQALVASFKTGNLDIKDMQRMLVQVRDFAALVKLFRD